MPYATLQDAITLYGETYVFTSVDRDDDGAADEAITPALAQASSEMDSYIQARYTLPLPSTPDVLVRFCVDIAIYQVSENAGSLTEEKRKRYEDAIKWLTNLAKNVVQLPIPPPAVDTSVNEAQITTQPRVMTRDSLRRIIC